MNRDEVLAFACGSICIQIHSMMPHVMQPVSLVSGTINQDTDLVTWLARYTRFLTLVKTTTGTRVYDHADDMLYYANPNTELLPACPDGHAFLCQTVCDAMPDGSSIPRLLVMDLIHPLIDCPRQRGSTLRALSPVLPHVCHVQWSGDKVALERFVARGMPHEVETLVALRHPLQLVRDRPAATSNTSIIKVLTTLLNIIGSQ